MVWRRNWSCTTQSLMISFGVSCPCYANFSTLSSKFLRVGSKPAKVCSYLDPSANGRLSLILGTDARPHIYVILIFISLAVVLHLFSSLGGKEKWVNNLDPQISATLRRWLSYPPLIEHHVSIVYEGMNLCHLFSYASI